jgi:crossover junction endodeoxyribonuclease RusA
VIHLTLPYPISANVYWRSTARFGRALTYVSEEAKDYREKVFWIAKQAGITKPMQGRVEIGLQLYPKLPKDWATRQRKLGATWDDGVLCLDIDNAVKVLLDSIKGLVIVEDGWPNRKLTIERMVPDGEARVELYVRPAIARAAPAVQGDLLGAVA